MDRKEYLEELLLYYRSRIAIDFYGKSVNITNVILTEFHDTDEVQYTFLLSNNDVFKIRLDREDAIKI
jgi:hypothetical protein